MDLSEFIFKEYDGSLVLVVNGPNKWRQLSEIIARIRAHRNQLDESGDGLFIVPEFIAQMGINNKNYEIDQKLLVGGPWEISSIQAFLVGKQGKGTK